MTMRSNGARRQRREQALRNSIDGIMRDTRYDRLRGQRARRTLVLAYALLLGALLPAYLAWGAIAGAAITIVGIAVLALLRLATRVVADAPPDLLDERQRALQGRAYLRAYRVVSSVVLLTAMVAVAVVLLSSDPDSYPLVIGVDAVNGFLLTVIGLTVGAPTCVVAWDQELI